MRYPHALPNPSHLLLEDLALTDHVPGSCICLHGRLGSRSVNRGNLAGPNACTTPSLVDKNHRKLTLFSLIVRLFDQQVPSEVHHGLEI